MGANRLPILPFLALVALASVANAQSIGDLKDVQGETILLRAQAAKAQAQAALDAARGTSTSTADDGTMPVVRGVFGNGRDLFATFLYGNGATVDAAAKNRIPGGFTVSKVSAIGVTLVKDGHSYEVGFSDRRPMPQAPASVPAPTATPEP